MSDTTLTDALAVVCIHRFTIRKNGEQWLYNGSGDDIPANTTVENLRSQIGVFIAGMSFSQAPDTGAIWAAIQHTAPVHAPVAVSTPTPMTPARMRDLAVVAGYHLDNDPATDRFAVNALPRLTAALAGASRQVALETVPQPEPGADSNNYNVQTSLGGNTLPAQVVMDMLAGRVPIDERTAAAMKRLEPNDPPRTKSLYETI